MASSPPAATNKPERPKLNIQPVQVNTSSPRFPPPPTTPNSIYTSSSPSLRRIAIAVDLSDESAFAVKWAVDNYIRPGDTVILLHARSTSILYGADWGSSTPTNTGNNAASNPFTKTATSPRQMQEQSARQQRLLAFFAVSSSYCSAKKANNLSHPLIDAHVPAKIHIVKDHDMKERLCLEVERLGLSTVIMGSRGIGALKGRSKAKLGSVSDYCVQHCACPVVVVRYKQEKDAAEGRETETEELPEFHDAQDQLK